MWSAECQPLSHILVMYENMVIFGGVLRAMGEIFGYYILNEPWYIYLGLIPDDVIG